MHTIWVMLMLAAGLYAERAAADLIECAQIESRWRNATAGASFAEWTRLYEDAHYESDCGGRIVADIGRGIIEGELPAIRNAYRSGADADEDALRTLQGRLEALQEYGSHWEIYFLLGETARKQRDARGALQAYRDALRFVDDEELTPTPPPRDEIALLRDRLDETAVIVVQLSPADMKLPVTRAGYLITQYSFATRGYKRRKALAPIQFVFAKDVMTDDGRTIFADVLETLTEQGSPDITVVGHTDPIGSAEANMRLSLERAAAIKRALLAERYAGRVTTRGRGEEQPFRFDDPGLYSEEARNQSHRRVEIVLDDN